MDRLKRAQVYLRDGKVWDWVLAMFSVIAGAELAIVGHVSPAIGMAASLREISSMPIYTHGILLALVGMGLSYATGRQWTSARAVLLLFLLNFYLFASISGAVAGQHFTAVLCGMMAGGSTWRMLALTWGGGWNGVGRDGGGGGVRRGNGLRRLPGLFRG